MKASQHKQLGLVVSRVQAAVNGILGDPMNDYAGFTPDPTSQVEAIVQEAGFANTEHFDAVVAARTSARWMHFNLGGYSA